MEAEFGFSHYNQTPIGTIVEYKGEEPKLNTTISENAASRTAIKAKAEIDVSKSTVLS